MDNARALPSQSRRFSHWQIHHGSPKLVVPISVGGDELIYLPADMLVSLQAVRGYETLPQPALCPGLARRE